MVAHCVTVMVIQAAVVRRLDARLPVDPALLPSIESSGRDAVGELRRTLGLLRGDSPETAQPPVGQRWQVPDTIGIFATPRAGAVRGRLPRSVSPA